MGKATGNYPITSPKNSQEWQEMKMLRQLLIMELGYQDPAGEGRAGLPRSLSSETPVEMRTEHLLRCLVEQLNYAHGT